MLSEPLQSRAALYVSGDMSPLDREAFDVVLSFHAELREHVRVLQEALATAAVSVQTRPLFPPSALRSRLLATLAAVAPEEPEALVATDPRGEIEWVNTRFTDMCGYSLEELRGRKPGRVLQGAETDRAAVGRIRVAMQELRPCHEQMVNYHKDGSPYRVDVRIMPVMDDDGQPLWFVAREREIR